MTSTVHSVPSYRSRLRQTLSLQTLVDSSSQYYLPLRSVIHLRVVVIKDPCPLTLRLPCSRWTLSSPSASLLDCDSAARLRHILATSAGNLEAYAKSYFGREERVQSSLLGRLSSDSFHTSSRLTRSEYLAIRVKLFVRCSRERVNIRSEE